MRNSKIKKGKETLLIERCDWEMHNRRAKLVSDEDSQRENVFSYSRRRFEAYVLQASRKISTWEKK